MDLPALPPRPDPQTGLPRPPHGPLEAGWTPGDPERGTKSILVAPPGQGPVLEHYRPSNRTALGVGIVWACIMFAYMSLRLRGLSWTTDPHLWSVWLIVLCAIPVLYLALRKDRVAAGAFWLKNGKQWVRTYELAKISLKPSGMNLMLQLIDHGGRKVRIRWNLIQENRALWDLVYNGILHSVCLGHAQADAGARRHLKLPGNP